MRCLVCDPFWSDYGTYTKSNSTFSLIVDKGTCTTINNACDNFADAMDYLDWRTKILVETVVEADSRGYATFEYYFDNVDYDETDKTQYLSENSDLPEYLVNKIELEISFDDFAASYMQNIEMASLDNNCKPFDVPLVFTLLSEGADDILDFSGMNFKALKAAKYGYYLMETIEEWAQDYSDGEKLSSDDQTNTINFNSQTFQSKFEEVENSTDFSDNITQGSSSSDDSRRLNTLGTLSETDTLEISKLMNPGETALSPKDEGSEKKSDRQACGLSEINESKKETESVSEKASQNTRVIEEPEPFEAKKKRVLEKARSSLDSFNKTQIREKLKGFSTKLKEKEEESRKAKEARKDKRQLLYLDGYRYPEIAQKAQFKIEAVKGEGYSAYDVGDQTDILYIVGGLSFSTRALVPLVSLFLLTFLDL